jgi:hypothetical protein
MNFGFSTTSFCNVQSKVTIPVSAECNFDDMLLAAADDEPVASSESMYIISGDIRNCDSADVVFTGAAGTRTVRY